MEHEPEKQKIGIKQSCCKDCYRAYHNTWAKLNRQKKNEYQRKWDTANKDKLAESRKAYYTKNKAKCNQRTRQWRREHQKEMNTKKRLKSKQEQDALIARDPLIAIMKPHFIRRTGKSRRDNSVES